VSIALVARRSDAVAVTEYLVESEQPMTAPPAIRRTEWQACPLLFSLRRGDFSHPCRVSARAPAGLSDGRSEQLCQRTAVCNRTFSGPWVGRRTIGRAGNKTAPASERVLYLLGDERQGCNRRIGDWGCTGPHLGLAIEPGAAIRSRGIYDLLTSRGTLAASRIGARNWLRRRRSGFRFATMCTRQLAFRSSHRTYDQPLLHYTLRFHGLIPVHIHAAT
jgi:hypothetical protein